LVPRAIEALSGDAEAGVEELLAASQVMHCKFGVKP
jgi:hypothetical protein